jgi:hypothetical protein
MPTYFRFWPLAAAPVGRSRGSFWGQSGRDAFKADVRFTPNSGREGGRSACPLWARSGHVAPSVSYCPIACDSPKPTRKTKDTSA